MSKYIIAAGHTASGTIGSGAVGIINESNCTRQVAPLVADKLKKLGHSVVYLQIDKSNSTTNEDCYTRAKQANEAGGDMFVEIHFNAGGGTGSEVLVNKNTSQNTKNVAARVSSAIATEMGFRDRGVKESGVIVLTKTVMPALLIECCFVDSSDGYIYDAEKLANGIVKGLTGQTVSNTTNSNTWKQGWNKNDIGWWYSPDPVAKTYYTDKDGWKLIDGDWYIFDSAGYALCNKWYYYSKDGCWYFLKEDCRMAASEWVYSGDFWYYLDKDGKMLHDTWLEYKGKKYYFDEDGAMLSRCTCNGHTFGPDGALV